MSLQDIFYIFGIVAMTLFIVFLAVAIYFVVFVKTVITRTERKVIGKIMEYTKPIDVFKGLSTAVAGNIFLKIRDNFGFK